ncbi:hypothetical protein D4764_03G0003040 [Takifugu flavidus]|uniref:Uncharacterized protein n=1 Tax=Takifugu flavidus TaxID=433684 RepID=A0A5C6N7E9_9TELE|nr:hypothetical protein D4764_03G0003040 [Takifugu flavidus]
MDGYLNLYILSGTLAFTIILASFMAVLLCNIYKSQSGRSGGSTLRYSDDPTTNEEGHTNEDVLHYAALRTSMTDRPKRQMGAINEEYGLVTRAADLRERIMKSWGNSTTSLPRLIDKVPDQSLLEDMKTALSTIPTTTITETNQLMYAAATVILQMLGYKMKSMNSHKEQMVPWRRRLEAKIMATRREVSLLTELSRGVNPRTEQPKKYNKLSIPEALETAKQRLTALATRLKRSRGKENKQGVLHQSGKGLLSMAGQQDDNRAPTGLRLNNTGRISGRKRQHTTLLPNGCKAYRLSISNSQNKTQ